MANSSNQIYGYNALMAAVANLPTTVLSGPAQREVFTNYTQVNNTGSVVVTNTSFKVWGSAAVNHANHPGVTYSYSMGTANQLNNWDQWLKIWDGTTSEGWRVDIKSSAFWSPYNVAPSVNDIIRLRCPSSGGAYTNAGPYIVLKCDVIPNNVSPQGVPSSPSNNSNYYQFSYVSASNDPICLTDTCDILTPNGYVNVKDLSVGDLVTTPEGKNVKITKVMKPTTHVAMGKALPHFIPKNSLGENKPSKDTFISKNHAYKSEDKWLCGQFNIEHNATNWDQDFVTYYNVMTEDYPKHSLVVNGVEMESWGGYEHNKPETHVNIKLRREKLGFK